VALWQGGAGVVPDPESGRSAQQVRGGGPAVAGRRGGAAWPGRAKARENAQAGGHPRRRRRAGGECE